MQIKNIRIYGLKESIIRSGYPMQIGEPESIITVNKHELIKGREERALKLSNTPNGSGHNNFLKGIIVQFDLQYPEYFSPQLQRYHWIDIVSSQSKMHKLTSRKLTPSDFTKETNPRHIEFVNELIFNRKPLSQIISNLPSGYLKWMGISTNYLQLKTIYSQRKHHKLNEWQYFCKWIETLPMSELIISKNK